MPNTDRYNERERRDGVLYIYHPLIATPGDDGMRDIVQVLRDLASQEHCDDEPYPQAVAAAEEIDFLRADNEMQRAFHGMLDEMARTYRNRIHHFRDAPLHRRLWAAIKGDI